MTRKQKRQRPAAGIELVAETDGYAAIKFTDPAYVDESALIHVYSKPHHDLLFKAFRVGLLFYCNRCKKEHIVRWLEYSRDTRRVDMTPPYHVLCTQIGHTWLVRADDQIPAHLKAYRIYTITGEMLGLLERISAALITSKDRDSG